MIPYVYDDGGKGAVGSLAVKDCVERAFAVVTGLSYQDARATMAVLDHWRRALQYLGWKWVPGPSVKLTDARFPSGRLIVQASTHIVAVIDGTVHDTHDPNLDIPRRVIGYYYKP